MIEGDISKDIEVIITNSVNSTNSMNSTNPKINFVQELQEERKESYYF